MKPNLAQAGATDWLHKQLQYQALQRKRLAKFTENKS